MKWFFIFGTMFCLCYCDDWPLKFPTVGVSLLIRNKFASLPYFFSCLEKLDYPKKRMYVWIHSDLNLDDSDDVIAEWRAEFGYKYAATYIVMNTSLSGHMLPDQETPIHWSRKRYLHVIALREKALAFARERWVDYHFMLDVDVFLTNQHALKLLIQKNATVVAPLLLSEGMYSNFWAGMTKHFYYERTKMYETIRAREEEGCFAVPMIHSAVLMNMRYRVTDSLTYDPNKVSNYSGPLDDIIAFAKSAEKKGVDLNICNDVNYGFVQVPLEDANGHERDAEHLLNVKLFAISQGTPLPVDPVFRPYITYPPRTKLGCDEIYMINLRRRQERRERMQLAFKELGIDANIVEAVDGRNIDVNKVWTLNITLMPEYKDPYYGRPMKAGEIGCFLSHLYIWHEVVRRNMSKVMVLEDDVRFEPYFHRKFRGLNSELDRMEWDFVYLGRKSLGDEEHMVSNTMSTVGYSYWTLGYIISASGAQKLIQAMPTQKLLPVDEFLPIMFDKHPNTTWKEYFPERNLIAYSAAPYLVQPSHYTGQKGYISDTEDSPLIHMSGITPSVRRPVHSDL